MSKPKFLLKNTSKELPDLPIYQSLKPLIIGRNQTTQIKNLKVSKCHLSLTASSDKPYVLIQHLGRNPSVVDSMVFRKLHVIKFKPKSKLRLLQSGPEYELIQFKSSDGVETMNEESSRPDNSLAKSWSGGLYKSINDPSMKVKETDNVIIIKDKYPKAKYHFLALPKKVKVSNLKSLNRDHIELLLEMEVCANELIKAYHPIQFRLGYHAIPSMSLVHLHIISQDFDSSCLKTLKHWNSFNTEYFLDSSFVIETIKTIGTFSLDTSKFKDLLKVPLKCHKCQYKPSNLPDLKKHLFIHSYM